MVQETTSKSARGARALWQRRRLQRVLLELVRTKQDWKSVIYIRPPRQEATVYSYSFTALAKLTAGLYGLPTLSSGYYLSPNDPTEARSGGACDSRSHIVGE